MTIRIILADDHTIVREGIRSLLDKEDDIEIIAEATDGRAAVELTTNLNPDVVVIDLAMPNMSGIEATQKICNKLTDVKVVVLSMHSDKRFISRALKAGARGYMLKDCAAEELIRAIRAVIANEIYLSPKIASSVVEGYLNHISTISSGPLSMLTSREREILQLVAEGKNTRDISTILELSVKTVETHRQRIMFKLNIDSIAGLTKYAISEGLASMEI